MVLNSSVVRPEKLGGGIGGGIPNGGGENGKAGMFMGGGIKEAFGKVDDCPGLVVWPSDVAVGGALDVGPVGVEVAGWFRGGAGGGIPNLALFNI